MAREAKTARHRTILEEMAQEWEKLTAKGLTPRSDRIPPFPCGAPFRSRDAATPAPFATRRLAIWDHGWRPLFPSTPRRSADTRLIAPFTVIAPSGSPALICCNAAAGRGFRTASPICQSFPHALGHRSSRRRRLPAARRVRTSAQARGAGCRTPPEWPLGGVFFSMPLPQGARINSLWRALPAARRLRRGRGAAIARP